MSQTYVTGWKIFLTRKLNPWDTSLYADRDLWITTWRLYWVNDSQQEWIEFTSVTASGSEFIYGWLTRKLSQTSIPTTAGTGLTWLASTAFVNVAMHDQLPDKTQPQIFGDSITTTDIRFSWTTTSWLRVKTLTTTQRLALTPANWDIVYDTTLWENYQYIAWAWSAISAGSTQANASTTVAGKVEIATPTEMDAWIDIWWTWASLVWTPSQFQRKEFVEKLNVTWLTEKIVISGDDELVIHDPISGINEKVKSSNFKKYTANFWDWSDWALTISSWTTTLTYDNLWYVEKNYSSINISWTATLTTSWQNANWWIAVINCLWDFTMSAWIIDISWKWWNGWGWVSNWVWWVWSNWKSIILIGNTTNYWSGWDGSNVWLWWTWTGWFWWILKWYCWAGGGWASWVNAVWWNWGNGGWCLIINIWWNINFSWWTITANWLTGTSWNWGGWWGGWGWCVIIKYVWTISTAWTITVNWWNWANWSGFGWYSEKWGAGGWSYSNWWNWGGHTWNWVNGSSSSFWWTGWTWWAAVSNSWGGGWGWAGFKLVSSF